MRVLRFETDNEAGTALAARVTDAIRVKPDLVLGLPAGRTMIPVYAALRRLRRDTALDTSRVVTFAVDEFFGLPADASGSFRQFLERHLLTEFGVTESRRHFLSGGRVDPEGESRRYEEAIAGAGGIDLQLLGIGANGHVAFNEPGRSLTAATHLVTLHEETRRANAQWFDDDPARVPREALSMGMGTLLRARTIALIATGGAKAAAVAAAAHGPVTTELPASFLQLHNDVELYVDRAAAALLD